MQVWQQTPTPRTHICKYCRVSHLPRWCPSKSKTCGGCEKQSTARQYAEAHRQAGTNDNNRSKDVHEMGQKTAEDMNTDAVNIKSLNLNSLRSVIITLGYNIYKTLPHRCRLSKIVLVTKFTNRVPFFAHSIQLRWSHIWGGQ